jgi:hypothetical protein
MAELSTWRRNPFANRTKEGPGSGISADRIAAGLASTPRIRASRTAPPSVTDL